MTIMRAGASLLTLKIELSIRDPDTETDISRNMLAIISDTKFGGDESNAPLDFTVATVSVTQRTISSFDTAQIADGNSSPRSHLPPGSALLLSGSPSFVQTSLSSMYLHLYSLCPSALPELGDGGGLNQPLSELAEISHAR